MQAVLPFSTERVFTRFFYQALAHGYSIAEALQLARGAIQGNDHRSGDLLDWSVPALFIGNSDPGPLLPRSAAAPVKAGPTRLDLKLGLRQGSERFYGRELPLRQAVEILAGKTSERVLVITGAAGVGKTELMDRTLEELGTAVTHVLYVPFDRLAPEVVQADIRLAGAVLALDVLAGSNRKRSNHRLVTELLLEAVTHPATPPGAPKSGGSGLSDLVRHKFVLAIEDIVLDACSAGWSTLVDNGWRAARRRLSMSGDQLLDVAWITPVAANP
jgi:hypothetical protein